MSKKMDEPSILMFPNPTSNLLNIEIRGSEDQPSLVKVIDMKGNVVMHVTVQEYRTAVLSLDGLSNGTYLVQVINNEVAESKRIMVQH